MSSSFITLSLSFFKILCPSSRCRCPCRPSSSCAQSLSSRTLGGEAKLTSGARAEMQSSHWSDVSHCKQFIIQSMAPRSMKLGLACYASRGKKTRALRRRNSGSETSKLQSVSRANTQKPRSLLPAPLASRVAPPQGRSASAAPRMTWSVFSRPPTPGFYCELPSLSPPKTRNMPNPASAIVDGHAR